MWLAHSAAGAIARVASSSESASASMPSHGLPKRVSVHGIDQAMREMPEGRGFLDSDLEVGFTIVSATPVICRDTRDGDDG
jgi:hypothetical protein